MHDHQRFSAELGQDVERHHRLALAGVHVQEAAAAGAHVVQILSYDVFLVVAHVALERDTGVYGVAGPNMDGVGRAVRADSEVARHVHF